MTTEPLFSETRLSEIQLTDEQRKRVLALYRESEGAYHDLFIACSHVISLRDKASTQELRIAELEKALKRIETWRGEFPDTGRQWDDGSPMSFGACFGSNGERDFMRQIATDALNGSEP